MGPKPPLSKEARRALAQLMGLRAEAEDLARLGAELSSVARNMTRLDALDLDGVEPSLVHFLPPNRTR